MTGTSAFRRTGRGTWTYRDFQVHRHKGSQFNNRAQAYRTDVSLGGEVITLSAPSLSELKWDIDRLVAEDGVPSDSVGPERENPPG